MALRNTHRERITCLEVLGLSEGASDDEIRKTYRKLALQHHPDKNAGQDSTGKFQEISCAYKYLSEGPAVLDSHQGEGFDIPFDILIRLFPWLVGDIFLNPFGMFGSKSGPSYFVDSDGDDDRYYMFSYNMDDSSDDGLVHDFASGQPKSTSPQKKQEKKQVQQQQKAGKTQTTSNKKLKEKQLNRQKTVDPDMMRGTTHDSHSSRPSHREDNPAKSEPLRQNRSSSSKVPSSLPTENKCKNNSNIAGQAKTTGKKHKKILRAEQRRREKEMKEIADQYIKKQKEAEKKEKEDKKAKEKDKSTAELENETKDESGRANADAKFENYEFDLEFLMEKKKSKRARKNERKRLAVESVVCGGINIPGNNFDTNSTVKTDENSDSDFSIGNADSTGYWTKLTESTGDFWEDVDQKFGLKKTKDITADSVYATLGQLDLNDHIPPSLEEEVENVSWYNNMGSMASSGPDTALYNHIDESREKQASVPPGVPPNGINSASPASFNQIHDLDSVDFDVMKNVAENVPKKSSFQVRNSVEPQSVHTNSRVTRGRGRGSWQQPAQNCYQPKQQYNNGHYNSYPQHERYSNQHYNNYSSYYQGSDLCYINGYVYGGQDYRTDTRKPTHKHNVYNRPPSGNVGPQHTYYNSRYQNVPNW